MKILIFIAAIFLLTFPLAACGKAKEPDFQTLYDSETKQTFVLGESRQSIVEKIGEGELFETEKGQNTYQYFDGAMILDFDEERLAAILVDASPRFTIQNYHDGTFLVEVKNAFPGQDVIQLGDTVYERYVAYYDQNGSLMEEPEGAYCHASILCDNAFSRLALVLDEKL